MNAKLLIVDDEETVRASLQNYFRREGFEVVVAEDGDQAYEMIKQSIPDLIILDVNMPNIDGLDVCRQIRQEIGQAVGIIMISGRKKEMLDRVVGLELGADIYLTKPFEARELLAQVKALLRRQRQVDLGKSQGWLVVDDHLRINMNRRIVEAGGKEVHLTVLEFDVLNYLIDRPGIPCGRADLLDNVWKYVAGWDSSDASINVCVARLRAKIEPDPSNPIYIQSVHGIGYRFKEF